MKIGVITSGGRVARWQADALRAVAEGNEFVLYDCKRSSGPRRIVKNAGYYLLNFAAVRNERSRPVNVPETLKIAARIQFAAEPDGAWELLPEPVLEQIRQDAPAVMLKFGMGLLRVPSEQQLKPPILSYHHGDPRSYRGRPAGFYELLQSQPTIGQIVQILSNRLDAGVVVAFGETKAHAHSWRQSLVESLRVSPLLLPTAIRNALAGLRLPLASSGRNYRLPSNGTAGAFALRLARAKLRRLVYGALIEKRWKVATATFDGTISGLDALGDSSIWCRVAVPKGCTFAADPFFDSAGRVLVEAMRRDGRGVIARVGATGAQPLPITGGHVSYPCTLAFDGDDYLLPEMSDWGAPSLFLINSAKLEKYRELDLPGRPRLLDATLVEHDGGWFLFGNRTDEGSGVLRLWTADSLCDRFAEHPASPIRISPAGARMGGSILRLDSQLFRPGQDFRRGYGDGIMLFRIDELSHARYREEPSATLRFTKHRGPHTLNLREGEAVFDYYDDQLTPLAGWRRLKQSRA